MKSIAFQLQSNVEKEEEEEEEEEGGAFTLSPLAIM